jgi:hypothetical protein
VRSVPHNESAWSYLCGVPYITCQALAALRPAATESTEPARDQAASAPADMPAGGGMVDRHAMAGLAACTYAAAEVLRGAVAELASAALRMALEAVQRHPACVPARVALLRLHVEEAIHNADASARKVASRNAEKLSQALQAMDPIHRHSYAALARMCV